MSEPRLLQDSRSDTRVTPKLETKRLRLRFPRRDDFVQFAELFASKRSRYIDGPASPENAWRNFATDVSQWGLQGFSSLAIELIDTRECAGQIGLNFPPTYPEREIGWMLWDGFEGHGYAYEAAMRVRRFVYEDLGWTTAVSYIDRENDRSIRVAERMGAVIDPDAGCPAGPPCLVYRHPPPG